MITNNYDCKLRRMKIFTKIIKSEKMSHTIRKKRVRFIGHIMRIKSSRLTKQIFNPVYKGKTQGQVVSGPKVLRRIYTK